MCTCEIVLEDRVCDHTEKCLSFADWLKLYHFQVKIYILPQQAVSRIIFYVPTYLSMMLIVIQSFHVNGIDLDQLDLQTNYKRTIPYISLAFRRNGQYISCYTEDTWFFLLNRQLTYLFPWSSKWTEGEKALLFVLSPAVYNYLSQEVCTFVNLARMGEKSKFQAYITWREGGTSTDISIDSLKCFMHFYIPY